LAKQGEQLKQYERRIVELETINRNLQKLLMEKSGQKEVDVKKPTTLEELRSKNPLPNPLPNNPLPNTVYGPALPPPKPSSKSEPLFKLDPLLDSCYM